MNNVTTVNNSSAIFTSGSVSQSVKAAEIEKKAISNALESENQKAERRDTFEKSKDTADTTGIYSRESIIKELKAAEEKRIQSFQDTIRSMMVQQGQPFNLTFQGVNLFVTEEDSKKAAESIKEGGEYSVNAVADRIMNMAKALSGGDSSKLSILREAVQKGFSGAAKVLGKKEDEMPDITKDTYKEVMKRFDEWEDSFKEPEETETESAE